MKRDVIDELPPFLSSWPRIYAFVIVYLVVLITLFWWFGKAWS